MEKEIEREKIENLQKLYPQRSVYTVIGSICIDPDLLRSKEVNLKEDDFITNLHKIIFSAIHNICYEDLSINKISEIDIDNYLSEFPHLYKTWKEYDGIQYVHDCIKNSNPEVFMFNYQRLKKFSLLRSYYLAGIDIKDVYDYTEDNIKKISDSQKKLDDMSVDEIIEIFTNKLLMIRDDFTESDLTEEYEAGDDIDNVIRDLGKEPTYGYPFSNLFYNSVFRGKELGKYMLRSADTGVGKTRTNIEDIVQTGAAEMYDIHKNKYIKNPVPKPSLIIFTETPKEDAQITMLAIISGIDEKILKDGEFNDSVRKRVEKAGEILKRSNIFVSYQDNFSILDIRLTIEKYIIRKDVQYVGFDYIQITPKLSQSLSMAYGYNLREDQMLNELSTALKKIANDYLVYVSSGTQLNRNSHIAQLRNQTSLRGGRKNCTASTLKKVS